ncbi:MAG: hypothetical protein K6F78_09850 [Bacteroidaceae bacterium]|nr:hypothetical protein [Bacteroidaceae bacterium]
MKKEQKDKRVVQIEIDDEVKKLTIEGVDKDAQVVMRQELSDDDLNGVAGGLPKQIYGDCYRKSQ